MSQEQQQPQPQETRILIPNDRIACEPFASLSLQVKTKGAFATVQQKNGTMRTKVVHAYRGGENCPYIAPGDEIIIDGNDTSHEWAKRRFEIDGREIILIPRANVLAIVARVPALMSVPATPFIYDEFLLKLQQVGPTKFYQPVYDPPQYPQQPHPMPTVVPGPTITPGFYDPPNPTITCTTSDKGIVVTKAPGVAGIVLQGGEVKTNDVLGEK